MMRFGEPTTFYQQSKDEAHLRASSRNYDKVRALYGQVPGGLFGGDENCRPGYTDPRQAVETCGMVEFMSSCERLLTVGGVTTQSGVTVAISGANVTKPETSLR